MITVCNRTETAARVKYAFESKAIRIDELCEPEYILQIDSKVLEEAEARDELIETSVEAGDENGDNGEETASTRKLTKAEQAERLRRMVDTVGKVGQPGEQIRNVISVSMLSEGWDAKTVTHILGLRAFTSQLLCEQVVGRGLRRTSYEINPETNFFEPEYVNIFGVPFTFLPHEGGEGAPPPPPSPKRPVEPDPAKKEFEIRWPNVLRIEHQLVPRLTLDIEKLEPLELNGAEHAKIAELAPIIDGKPNVTERARIELRRMAEEKRMQTLIFEVGRDLFAQEKATWKGSPVFLFAQLVALVERVLKSDKISIKPEAYAADELLKKLIIILNMTRIVEHIRRAVQCQNTERFEIVLDREHPIRSTGDMRTWYTGKPCERTRKSHINVCVYDSTWEASDAYRLDNSDLVKAWVKNDHLGFEIAYLSQGGIRKYRPDFLVRLVNGDMLILETKGKETETDRDKYAYLKEWTQAVTSYGRFGRWHAAVARAPGEIEDILAKYAKRPT